MTCTILRNLGPSVKANNADMLLNLCNVQTNMGISLHVCREQKTDYCMLCREEDDRDQI